MKKKDPELPVKRFKNGCTCGGYAWSMNGRAEEQPHMAWCPQLEEYGEWYRSLHAVVTTHAGTEK